MMKMQTLTRWLISESILIFAFLFYQPVSAQSLVNPTIGTKLLVQARSFWQISRNHYQSKPKEILHTPQVNNLEQPDIHETLQELAPTPSDEKVYIYVFWGDGCPHCEIARPAIKSFAKRFDIVEVREYEVWYHPENQELFINMATQLGFEPHVVPTIIIGEKYWEGFAESILPDMENAILTCEKKGCLDPGTIVTPIPNPTIAPAMVANSSGNAQVQPKEFTPTVTTPSNPPSAKSLSNGFTLAIAVTLGMVVALIFSGLRAWRCFDQNRLPQISEAKTKWRRASFIALTLIGLGVASYLAYVETQVVRAVCGPVGDCNAVQSSPYAYLFGWLPVGVFGLLGYLAILAAWSWEQLRKDWLSKFIPLIIFGMTLFGVLFSLYLTILETFVIKAVCMWCISSSIIMTLLLLLSLDPALHSLIGDIDAE